MMTFKETRDVYWKYYISLENQFLETSRYVEFDFINNGRTYSIEYLKLFQAVCSEIDVVGKVLASTISETFKPTKKTGINEWWYYITAADTSLTETKCSLFGEHDLQPWVNFKVIRNKNPKAKKYILDPKAIPKAQTPAWWNDYNSVKHNRTEKFENATNYAKANLQNLFFAFAALFVLEVKLMEMMFEKGKNDTIPTELESGLFKDNLPFYTYLLSVGPQKSFKG